MPGSYLVFHLLDMVKKSRISLHQNLDSVNGIEDGGMIPAELNADLREAHMATGPHKICRHLPRVTEDEFSGGAA